MMEADQGARRRAQYKAKDTGKEKKKRFHNKSKNGCGTCKIRRVKCDEGRPICQRCIKAGLDCDGYQQEGLSRRWIPPSSRNPSVLNSASEETAPATEDTRSPAATVCRSPPRSLFKNDQEQRYFKLFSTQTARQLTGLFSSEIWSRLILQTCETHPSIRHAIIAIGALDPKTWRSPAKSPEETARRQFAYHEYSLAITDMRNTISQGKFDLRTKLIACIVCVCFEIYHYNKISAFEQIRSMSLLIEAQEEKAPLNIDDELLETFSELQIQSLIHGRYGQIGKSPEQLLLYCRRSMRDSIPAKFTSMRQARSEFHRLQARQVHWNGSSRYGWPWYVRTGIEQSTGSSDPPPNEVTSNEEWCEERNRRFLEFTAWSNAFQPLFDKARSSNDPDELRRATILKIMYLYTYLTMMTPMLTPQESYYGQTDKLTELMNLLKTLVPSFHTDSGFSIEANFLVPLSVITYRYRHRALRQEAIKLLLQYPRREGLWDGVLIGKYSKWLAEIEEEELTDEEYVPLELATDFAALEWDSVMKTAKVVAWQKFKSPLGRKEKREVIIDWSG